MKHQTLLAVVLPLAGLGAAAGVYLLTSSAPGPSAVRSRPDQLPASDTTNALPNPSVGSGDPCRPATGDEGAWDVTLDTVVRADGQPSQVHRTTSTLVARVVASEQDHSVLLARWVDTTLPFDPLTAQSFDEPMLFRLGNDCGIDAFAYREGTPLRKAREQQSLLWDLSWRRVDQEATTADNRTGPHESVHAVGVDEEGPFAQRSIRLYHRTWDDEAPVAPLTSLLTVRPGDGLWFDRMQGEERLPLADGSITSRLQVRSRELRPDVLADIAWEQETWRWANLLPVAAPGRRPARAVTEAHLAVRQALQPMAVGDALDWMMERQAQGEDWPELVDDLSLWLEARPDQTGAVAEAIAAGGLPTQAVNTLYMAMGLARTDEARTWLTEIASDAAAPPFHRLRAMHNMLDRDDVGVGFAAELAERGLAALPAAGGEDAFHGRHALMALGALATMQQHPDITDLAMRTVDAALVQVTDAGSLRPVVGAIANLGDPTLLAAVEPWTRHPDVEMRDAVSRVVRRMPPEATEVFTRTWLAQETSTLVRGDVWTTVARQHRDAAQSLSPALLELAVDHLRSPLEIGPQLELVHLLGPLASTDPGARDALVRLALQERDSASQLTSVIARYLDADALAEVFP